MLIHQFEALGTHFKITLWDNISQKYFDEAIATIIKETSEFENLYSRFNSQSLVTKISSQVGIIKVPKDMVKILRLYQTFNLLTLGKINPGIGFTLADTGYDQNYSLIEKSKIRPVSKMNDSVIIIDDEHIELLNPLLFDFGAIGKGYIIDKIYDLMNNYGFKRFLVDGSGDIRYQSDLNEEIVCGLEHPLDTSKVIGTIKITKGAICASATNRRQWGQNRNHYIDPDKLISPDKIIAVWVLAKNASLADGLASALFFTEPENITDLVFEYLIVNSELKIKRSTGFTAELF